MSIVITHELYSFSYIVIASCIVCVVFDFFRELFKTCRTSVAVNSILDILFWIFCIIFMWVCLLSSNDGKLRSYQIIGGVLGGILYFLSISPVMCLIFRNIFKFLQFILKILLTPVRFLYKILNRVLVRFLSSVKQIFKKLRSVQWLPKKRKVKLK